MVILTDSREKESSHVLDWFDKKNISHKIKALGNGDYSFYIPANSDLNIERDLYFDKEIMIERKASLEELSTNLTAARTRFEEEMATYKGKKYLLIENADYSDIASQNYTSKFSPKAYLASIHTFNHRYNLEVVFMPKKEFSPVWIYGTFTYYLKNIMR